MSSVIDLWPVMISLTLLVVSTFCCLRPSISWLALSAFSHAWADLSLASLICWMNSSGMTTGTGAACSTGDDSGTGASLSFLTSYLRHLTSDFNSSFSDLSAAICCWASVAVSLAFVDVSCALSTLWTRSSGITGTARSWTTGAGAGTGVSLSFLTSNLRHLIALSIESISFWSFSISSGWTEFSTGAAVGIGTASGDGVSFNFLTSNLRHLIALSMESICFWSFNVSCSFWVFSTGISLDWTWMLLLLDFLSNLTSYLRHLISFWVFMFEYVCSLSSCISFLMSFISEFVINSFCSFNCASILSNLSWISSIDAGLITFWNEAIFLSRESKCS